ncbi:hypothetical protein IW261DRAFT_1477818 [Armillaria novae-zelandiae]|uniref:Uncharacterized protein n=1 Tax=Armillaria novae-zelandiae TaxID=153914 RepID=A0AA39UAQ5_9AGAR|nr:hypothetical protein IW261DRAFT_1477818 [Armillaria novae-zelandiae]
MGSYVRLLPFRGFVRRASSMIRAAPPSRSEHRLASSARDSFLHGRLHWSDFRQHSTPWLKPLSRHATCRRLKGFHVFVVLNTILCSLVIGYKFNQKFHDALHSKIDEASLYQKTESSEDDEVFIMNFYTAVALKIFDANHFHLVDFNDYASTVYYFCALHCEGMVDVPVEIFFQWYPQLGEFRFSLYEYHRDILLSLPDCEMRDKLHERMRDACLRLHALLTDSCVQDALWEMYLGLYGEQGVKPVTWESTLCVSQLGEGCFYTLVGIMDKAEGMVDYTLVDIWR